MGQRRDGWFGSLNRSVRRDVREHLRTNSAARRTRYSLAHRLLRRFLSLRTFGHFIWAYLLMDLTFVATEALSAWVVPTWLPAWTAASPPSTPDLKTIVLYVSGYVIGAQV